MISTVNLKSYNYKIALTKNQVNNAVRNYLNDNPRYYKTQKETIIFNISFKNTNIGDWILNLIPIITKDGEPTVTLNLDWTTSVNNGDINNKLESYNYHIPLLKDQIIVDINNYLTNNKWSFKDENKILSFTIDSTSGNVKDGWNVVLKPTTSDDNEPYVKLLLNWTWINNNDDINLQIIKNNNYKRKKILGKDDVSNIINDFLSDTEIYYNQNGEKTECSTVVNITGTTGKWNCSFAITAGAVNPKVINFCFNWKYLINIQDLTRFLRNQNGYSLIIGRHTIQQYINFYLGTKTWYYLKSDNIIMFKLTKINYIPGSVPGHRWDIILVPNNTKEGEKTIILALNWINYMQENDIDNQMKNNGYSTYPVQ